MDNTFPSVYDDLESNDLWNSTSDNTTYDMDLEAYEAVLQFVTLTRYIIPILVGLITLFGLVGNIMIITVFVFHKAIRGITNTLIMSLAIADLLVIVFCIPFKAVYPALHFWPLGDIWCRIHTYIDYVCYLGSMYTLVLLSLDRYIALVHPVKALLLRTTQNCYIALVVLWSFVILGNIPFLFIATEVNIDLGNVDDQIKVCTHQFEDDYVSSLCLFVLAYLLPQTLLCVLYGHMLKVFLARKTPRAHSNGSHVRLQSNKRVTMMAVWGVTVCVLCRLPLQIIMIYNHVSKNTDITVTFASIAYAAECLANINSCINPILYTFYTHTFRNGIKNMFCCRKTKHNTFASHRSLKYATYTSVTTT